MKTLKLIAALTLGTAVSACGAMPDIASRNAPFETTSPQLSAAVPQVQLPQSMRVTEINVAVPRSLKVSEANGYYPRADIVWRGDAMGDRHQQIANIFQTAFTAGTRDMAGETDVVLDVELTRFHSVTERTRYSVGGVHNMEFKLTVRSAATGLQLAPTREIIADLPAFGGRQALAAEAQGQTQKVRVTNYLALVIQDELKRTVPAPQPGAVALVDEIRN